MIKDRWSIDNQITVRVGERLENSALPFSGRHPIVLTWCFQITSHLKNQGKAMSMNEIRSHLVSKIYVVVINIFSHNRVIQSHRVEAPWTRFLAGYCWWGEKRAGRTTSHSVRIRLRGARISLFRSAARVFRITRPLVRHAENTAEAFHSENERPFVNGSISAKKTRCYQQRCCFAESWFMTLSRDTSALVTIALRHRDWPLDRLRMFSWSSQTIATFC